MGAVLIVNPLASKVSEERLASVQAALPQPLSTILTRGRGDATELVRELEDSVSAIYVFSGDGTYNEVLNGAGGRIPLGFVPGGGTSVLPRALGLPRDPVAAARQIARGRTRRISLGRADGRRFGFSAGLGVDAELIRAVDALGRSADGSRPGDRAFVGAALGLIRDKRFRVDPSLDLAGLGRAAFVFAANCSPYTYFGRLGLRFAPDATFEGGIDVVAPERIAPGSLPRLVWWAAGRGRHHVRAHDADRLDVVCDRPTALQVDGEDLGDVDRVVLEAERDAVTVLC